MKKSAGGAEYEIRDGKPVFPPERLADGSCNPGHYRAQLRWAWDRAVADISSGDKAPWLESFQKNVLSRAELAGLDPKGLVDARSDADKLLDAARMIVDAPQSVLELADELVSGLERLFDEADFGMVGTIDEAAAARRAATGKSWAGLLRRVLILRGRARHPSRPGLGDREDLACRAAQTLRYMVYVNRSNMGQAQGVDGLLQIGSHHLKMSLGLFLAEQQGEIDEDGRLDQTHWPYEGCMLVCPPGHGKTELGAAWMGLRISRNPRTQALLGHAQQVKAQDNMRYVRAMLDLEHAAGRRNRALFPRVPMLSKTDNNMRTTRLLLETRTKSPTMAAYGVTAKISGSDADVVWLDDAVDQSVIEIESERSRVFTTIHNNWFTRLRGRKGTFKLITTTLWHPDDAHCRMLRQTRSNQPLWLKTVVQRCGGPPNFKPLWPGMYGEAFLRQKYVAMNNPRMFSCVYESNPVTEETRIVRRVRWYDPAHPEHHEFLRSAVFHLSLDPSATNRATSDRAGVVYAALGHVRVKSVSPDGATVTESIPRLRVLDAFQINATQSELTDRALSYVHGHKTDYVHIETRSGFHGMAEMFEMRLGGDGRGRADVIRHDPGGRQKALRLRAVAPYIEDYNLTTGVRACVEFPGRVMPDGTVGPSQEMQWLADQVERFGFTGEDHAVDALTQLVNHVSRDLVIGGGGVTTVARRVEAGNAMLRAFYARIGGSAPRGAVGNEDVRFVSEAFH